MDEQHLIRYIINIKVNILHIIKFVKLGGIMYESKIDFINAEQDPAPHIELNFNKDMSCDSDSEEIP